jgi:hypothetical protein
VSVPDSISFGVEIENSVHDSESILSAFDWARGLIERAF